jgi:hypothetical protein
MWSKRLKAAVTVTVKPAAGAAATARRDLVLR